MAAVLSPDRGPARSAPLVALVAVVVIVYHNALLASFFDDDYQWLVGSWSFQPSQLVAFSSMSHFYRPAIEVYFGLMTPLLSGSPVLFHAASVLLHAAVVLVVFALAARIAHDRLFGFLAALFFAVQPSDVDAIAWVGALAEGLGALFGCLALLWFLQWRDHHTSRHRALSITAYALALLTHESSVVFLVVIAMLDWLRTPGSRRRAAPLIPYVVATAVYLAIELYINSRNYVVSEGHYAIGAHMIRNALDYIDALYVGRHDAFNDAVIAIGVIALLWRGNARVRFATCWMLLALAPFLAFTWANTSRYLYQPAIGFSMLLAEGVLAMARRAGHATGAVAGMPPARETAAGVTLVLATIVAVRFGIFAERNVGDFATRSQVYPAYLARFRHIHPELPAHAVLPPDSRLSTTIPHQFVSAAVQWEYGDPTIQLEPIR